MLVAVEILQSDWTAIFLQQNKSGHRAGTRPSVFCKGRVTPDYYLTALMLQHMSVLLCPFVVLYIHSLQPFRHKVFVCFFALLSSFSEERQS